MAAARFMLAKALDERGQGLILAVLSMSVLLGFTALVADAGTYLHEKRELQKAADAAALAGAAELTASGCGVCAATQTAREYVELNGIDDGDPGTTVQVTTPYEGDSTKIAVTISREVGFLFGPVIGIDAAEAEVLAVAGVVPGSGDYAIVVLGDYACPGFKQSGSANLTVTGGGIMINSDCSEALKKTGSGDLTATVINYFEEGSHSIGGSGSVTPLPSPVGERVEDPLQDWVPPAPGAPAPGSAGTAANPQLTHLMGSSNKTVYPGTYYGGLKISSSGNVTFEPGIYIMAGGGMDLGGSGNKVGDGVMFYNTNDPSQPTGAGDYGQLKITGSGNIELSAPTDGSYPNMLFWQAPLNTKDFDISGSGNLTEGIFYLPTAKLNISGSGDIGAVQFIVGQFEKTGSGTLTVTYGDYVDVEGGVAIRLTG
jgi:Flp pilus assembly protein TadG